MTNHRRATGIAAAILTAALGASAGAAVSTTSAAAAETGAVKSQIRGFIDRDGFPRADLAGAVVGRIVDTSWASLQPTKGGPLAHPNDIDRAITTARAKGILLKLRVRAGIDAPAWAKSMDGSPIVLRDIYTGAPETIGRFWTPKFTAAYVDLQQKLAAAYDSVPEIRETAISQCATQYAETYLRGAMDRRNLVALDAAGLTTTTDAACHANQIRAHRVWTRTLSDLALNPYQAIQRGGGMRTDDAVTAAAMVDCRNVLGKRCVLENNSIRSSYIARSSTSHYGKMYAAMRAMGKPLSYQTAAATRIGDWKETVSWAAAQGAGSVELPYGYTAWPLRDLTSHSRLLAAN